MDIPWTSDKKTAHIYCDSLAIMMTCAYSTDTMEEIVRAMVSTLITVCEASEQPKEAFEDIIELLNSGFRNAENEG